MEKLKNIFIIFLMSLMGILSYLSFAVSGGDSLSQVWEKAFGDTGVDRAIAIEEYSYRKASVPYRISVVKNGEIHTQVAMTKNSELYKEIEPFYLEAVGSMGQPERCSEGDFLDIYKGKAVILKNSGKLPLFLMGLWANGRVEQDKSQEAEIKELLIFQKGRAVCVAYADKGSGNYYISSTSASTTALETIFMKEREKNGVFAKDLEGVGGHFPYEILQTKQVRMETFKIEQDKFLFDSAKEAEILGLMSMNHYMTNRYQESTGSKIYVDEQKTLRAQDNGSIIFTTNGAGIVLNSQGLELTTQESVGLAVTGAVQIFEALTEGDERISLDVESVTQVESRTDITFFVKINGATVGGGYGGGLSVEGGQIKTLRMNIPNYIYEGQGVLMSEAMAAPLGIKSKNMEIMYMEAEGLLMPVLSVIED